MNSRVREFVPPSHKNKCSSGHGPSAPYDDGHVPLVACKNKGSSGHGPSAPYDDGHVRFVVCSSSGASAASGAPSNIALEQITRLAFTLERFSRAGLAEATPATGLPAIDLD